MLQEIREGIGSTGVRCGLIGEIGCSYPLQDSEKRALQAAAMVQQQSGDYHVTSILVAWPSCVKI